jgi:hypothetical protein
VYVDSLGAFDISAYHATGGELAKYADLTAALGTNGANIPEALRKGGMSVKFVQSSDNNSTRYVQYRLMSDTFNTTPSNWQGVDDEPIAGSRNLVESGGVYDEVSLLERELRAFENGNTVPEYTLTSGYITTSGTIKSSSLSKYTSPFLLEKGRTVYVRTAGMNMCIIAKYENGTYIPLCNSEASLSDTLLDYTYTTNEDIYVVISIKTTIEGYFIEKNSLDIEDEIIIDSDRLISSKGVCKGLSNLTFTPSVELSSVSSANNSKLNANGIAVQDNNYMIVKYLVSEGDILKLKLLDGTAVMQFQNTAYVPNYGTNTGLVGKTYREGIGMIKVPTGATHLIVSRLKSNTSDTVEKIVDFDSTPTENSVNMVRSGGIFDCISKIYKTQELEYNIISDSAVIVATGDFVNSSVNDRTDYIDISSYNVIEYSQLVLHGISSTSVGIAFYDVNYGYVSGQLAQLGSGKTYYKNTYIFKPTCAKYIVLTIRKNLEGFFVSGLTEGLITDVTRGLVDDIDGIKLNQWQYAAKQRYNLLAKTKWTPITGIAPVNTGNSLFPADVEHIGMPYSSTRQIDKYIGYNVSLRTFLTAVHNRYSLLYTENINGADNISAYGFNYLADQCATYMGVQCTTFVNYICGSKVVWLSHQYKYAEKMGYIENLGRPNHNKIRLFDIIYLSGHDMIVSDIQYNEDFSISSITVSQATTTGYKIVSSVYTASAFDNAFYNGTYKLYRISQSYNPSLSVEKLDNISYNDDICTFLGDYACFRQGDRIVINYTAGSYTAVEIYKENTLINTLSIDASQHSIDITSLNLTYGLYKARLTDGTNNSNYTRFEVVDCNVSLTLSEQTKCLVEFSSHNGLPIYVDFCAANGNSVARKQFEPQELLQGFALIDVAVLNSYQPRYDISGCYCKVTFKGEYGEVVNEMIPTGIN